MPEGDSLHRAAARLQPLVGHVVSASSPHPRGLLTGVAAAVDGRRLDAVEAVGKNLLLRFEGGITVRSHLRMNGRWRIGPAGATKGAPWLVLRAGSVEATQWNGPILTLEQRSVRALGPDLLSEEVAVSSLVPLLRRADGTRRLGEVMQDQRLVAGIGNMWMAEALWAVGVSPWLPLHAASDEELRSILEWARAAMGRSVAGARPARSVYRRAGRACRRCGTTIEARGQGDDNRTAYWCPGCQRLPLDSRLGRCEPGNDVS